ncbi:MAG TPA: MipA/OmpV family protein [Burkholderiales bacterium]|nr:MipA/OmpV family protein [Burkholderiales bacterium]
MGAVVRMERSPYRGAGNRRDFIPMYLYEGDLVFLRSNSVGLKLEPSGVGRVELFFRHRFEGTPFEDIPPSLAGMARREPGIDAGIGAHWAGVWGTAYAELLQDASTASEGSELRLGYKYPWRRGRLSAWPYAFLALRSSELNDYYYGVRPGEATAGRPAYEAQSGVGGELGVLAAYPLAGRWRLLAGASLAWLPRTAAESPIVEQRVQPRFTLGALYDLSPQTDPWTSTRPLIVRAYYGQSSDCDVVPIATLRCTSTHTQDKTDIAGIDFGRPFITGLNDWPVDLAGFVGIIRHKEKGFQPDFWQVNLYLKAWYYGFPWSARLRTRLGLGVGLAFAEEVPLAEQRDQALRGRGTSKLLQTLDPTLDFSLGDLVASPRLRDTFLGVGVSHRSGIFGTSHLLRNVDGGSNYIYGYVESSF